jgi:hypothetical protein
MSRIALPQDLKESIDLYVEQGIPTGSFLQACIENDSKEAVGAADERNIRLLPEIVQYLYWECPHASWGKKGAFEKWIKAGGLAGVAK